MEASILSLQRNRILVVFMVLEPDIIQKRCHLYPVLSGLKLDGLENEKLKNLDENLNVLNFANLSVKYE